MYNTESVKENQVMFGKYYCYGVPCIEIITPDGNKYYLSAFRRYCFQISCTYNGSGNAGSTPVFGLETLSTIVQKGSSNLNQENTVKFIISAVAMDAIQEFCNSYGYFMPKNRYTGMHANEEWGKFIEEVYKFCRHESIENVPLEGIDR